MSSSKLRDLEKPNKYKDFLRNIAKIQVKHPFITIAIIMAITIALFGGISQVKTVASLEKMMPTDIEEIKSFNILRDNFLGQDIIAVVLDINQESTIPNNYDITEYEYYIYAKNLKTAFSKQDNVVSTYSFSDVIDGIAKMKGVTIDNTNYNVFISDTYVQNQISKFVNLEKTNTIIIVTTDISADDLRMNLLSDNIKKDIDSLGRPNSVKISITGTPIIQQKLGEVIEHDRKITERLSAVFVFILVAIVFGSFIAALVPMVTILLSIIWLYGVMGYTNLPISTLAGGVAAMVIGIGVDYSIHLRNKFEYERKKGESIEFAVEETMANTGYVLTIVTIVTSIAFLSFLLGEMPEMGRFGLLMTIGVNLAFFLSVIGLPALFIIEEKIIYFLKNKLRFGIEKEFVLAKKEELKTKTKRGWNMSFIRKLGYSLGKKQAKHPMFFVILALLITVATLPGIPILLNNVEPSLEKVLPQDIEEVKVMNDMRSQYGADMLYLVLISENMDITSPESVRYVDSMTQSLRTLENIVEVNSYADFIKEDSHGYIPNSENDIKNILEKDLRINDFINKDRTITVIQIKSDTGASAKTVKKVMDDIKFTKAMLESENPGFDVKITGFNAIDQATFKVIISDFMKITLVSFGLMVLFLLFHYRFSIKKTVYSLVIMMFSLIWALGVTGYIGIKLNVVTMVSAAMIIALGSSYGINSVYHFYDDFLLQYEKKEAIAKFQEFLIIGLSGSAFAEIAGFLALLFGIMPSMQDLGIILAIGIFFALFVSVVILPVFFYMMECDNNVKNN